MEITITERLEEQHIIQLHQLYQNEWWTNARSLTETQKGVKGSQLCLGLVNEGNQLVGFCRVLTDFTFKALLFDLIVHPSLRQENWGKKLCKTVINHPKLSQVKHIELYCLPELSAYYASLGFSNELGELQLMRLTHNT